MHSENLPENPRMNQNDKNEKKEFISLQAGPRDHAGEGLRGSLEVIVGSMFSGKTEELIRRLRRSQLARQSVQVFKPRIDVRYARDFVASHNQIFFPSITIEEPAEIFNHLLPQTQVVGIDEGQFFSSDLVRVSEELAARGLRVLVAGLDTDWLGQPFEPMPQLLAVADVIDKPRAVCVVCGSLATRTQKIRIDDEPGANDPVLGGENVRVQVGGRKEYEARCRKHFVARVDAATPDPNDFVSEFLKESPALFKTPQMQNDEASV